MFDRRVRLLTLVFASLLGVTAVRLFHLQIVRGDHYSALARKGRQWERLVSVPRGRILDMRGEVLACDTPSYGLALVASEFPLERVRAGDVAEMFKAMRTPEERLAQRARFRGELAEREASVQTLARLTGWNVERIAAGVLGALENAVRYGNTRGPEPILFDLDRATWLRLEILLNPPADSSDRKEKPVLPGVRCITRARRAYPNGDIACHLIGHVGEYGRREIDALREDGRVIFQEARRMAMLETAARDPLAREEFTRAFGRPPEEIASAAELSGLLRKLGPDELERLSAVTGPAWSDIREWISAPDLVELSESELEWLLKRGHLDDRRMGRMGIELAENERLRGRHGHRVIMRGVTVVDGEAVPELDYVRAEDPEPGSDVTLTIDLRFQRVVQDLLDRTGLPGAAIFIEPATGAVRAMASSPAFDPNVMVSGDPASIRAMFDNPERPLLNRVTQGVYPPGSVFKVPVASAVLEEGVLGPGSRLVCAHTYNVGGRDFRCLANPGHGPVDVAQALAMSCNIYFYKAAEQITAAKLVEWARGFGFGERTGIALPGESTGSIPTPAEAASLRATSAVQVGIGQGPVAVTPVQVAAFFAALANDGVSMRPRVVDGEPETSRVIRLSPSTRQALLAGMTGTCHDESGTAYSAFNRPLAVGARSFAGEFPGLMVAAKTGTAEHRGGTPHSWFGGFAPAGKPALAFALVVEDAGHGGDVSAPLVARMLYTWFKLHPPGGPR